MLRAPVSFFLKIGCQLAIASTAQMFWHTVLLAPPTRGRSGGRCRRGLWLLNRRALVDLAPIRATRAAAAQDG